jgi:outer membrane lipoprotein-sorting protein
MRLRSLAISCLALAALSLPHGAVAQSSDRPADIAPDLWQRLKKLDQRLEEVHTLTARFTRLKHTPMLKEPLTSRGRVFVEGQNVRWETVEPRQTVTWLGPDRVRIYQPEEKHVEIYPLRERFGQFGASPMPRMTELTERFQIERIDPSAFDDVEKAGERYLALRLRPRQNATGQDLDRLLLLLDREAGHISRMQLHVSDNEWTAYRFGDVQLDVDIPDGTFELDLPADVEISRPMQEDGRP